MANSEVTFNADKTLQAVHAALADALNECGKYLSDVIKRRMGTMGTAHKEKVFGYKTVVSKTGNQSQKVKTTRTLIHGAFPGAYPAIRKGKLKRSIKLIEPATPDNLVCRVGSENVKYALALEYGFMAKLPGGGQVHVQARPWAMRTLTAEKDNLDRLFNKVFDKSIQGRLS